VAVIDRDPPLLGADASATQELCDQYGGRLIANTAYMVHVWPVPGYESDEGMFSNLNSKLTCPNGTYYTVPMDEIGHRTNVCADVEEQVGRDQRLDRAARQWAGARPRSRLNARLKASSDL
jgi:hypothetical protein